MYAGLPLTDKIAAVHGFDRITSIQSRITLAMLTLRLPAKIFFERLKNKVLYVVRIICSYLTTKFKIQSEVLILISRLTTPQSLHDGSEQSARKPLKKWSNNEP